VWHSWNIQLVHFISYSTEALWARKQDVARQRAWLEADLIEANKHRDQQPWIVAYGHRPMYCSNDDGDDCTDFQSNVRLAFEELFYTYGVDVIIEAHEHSYERLWPVYNLNVTDHSYDDPHSPVHIITGAAGCNEDTGDCLNMITKPQGPWSALRSSGKQTYGYGHLIPYNSTHLYWDELAVVTGQVLDKLFIVQHHHGPFGRRSSK